MATTGHENESINVGGLKSSLQALKTKFIDDLDSRTDTIEEALDTGGSVDSRIADAKTEIIGGATTNGNTLKKLEDRVSPLETAIGSGGSIDTRITNAINALDSTASQSASAGNGYLNLSISEVNGKIDSISGSISSNTYDAYGSSANESTRAQNAELALSGRVGTLETTVGSGGSIDSRISSATTSMKNEIIGDAASDYNTLGKIEDKIQIEATRAQTAEQQLREQYSALTQSDIIVGALPSSGTKNKIYRVPGTSSYSDYMWNGSSFVKMAEYDNAIDDEPIYNCPNLVKSGGVAKINMNLGLVEDTLFMKDYAFPGGSPYTITSFSGWAIFYKYVEQGKLYRISLYSNDAGHSYKQGILPRKPTLGDTPPAQYFIDDQTVYTTYTNTYIAPISGYLAVNCYIGSGGNCSISEPLIADSIIKLPNHVIAPGYTTIIEDSYYSDWTLRYRPVKQGEIYHILYVNADRARTDYRRCMTLEIPAKDVNIIMSTYKEVKAPTAYEGLSYEEYYEIPFDGYLCVNGRTDINSICNIIGSDNTIISKINKIENQYDAVINSVNDKNTDYFRFKIISWNMEFFGMGDGTTNKITTEALYEQYRPIYRQIFDEVGADFVGICEFEPIFWSGHPAYTTKRELFPYYKSSGEFFKTPDNSSLAFFSHLNITNVTEVAFNQYAPGEYRFYIVGDINIGTRTIKIVVQHISWQSEYVESQSNQLISDFAPYENVIIMGDFNCPPSVFDKFKNNGYVCANCDYLGSLPTSVSLYQGGAIDNICVKGGSITKTEAPNVNEGYSPILSDHLPIICEVIF